jgi:hypothetical protein
VRQRQTRRFHANASLDATGHNEVSTPLVEFRAASNQRVTFASGANGQLKLDKAESYNGTVIGFSGPSGGPIGSGTTTGGGPRPVGGDSIDLADFAYGTGARPSLVFTPTGTSTNPGGTLTLTDGKLVANIALVGQYSAAGFHEQIDSGGTGTLITYTNPIGPPPIP